jgi:hypothetical protein
LRSGPALDKAILDSDFKLDLERNFLGAQADPLSRDRKWMQDDYDENRAILKELGMLQ